MKGLRVIKTVREIKSEEVWGELESKKKKFPEIITNKISETNSSFYVK